MLSEVKETLELKNPLKGKSTAVKILVVVGILLCIVAVGAVIYKLAASNAINVDVNEQTISIPVSLSASATTLTEGQVLTLTATATGPNAAQANGHSVNLLDNGSFLATLTFSGTTAQYQYTPLVGSHVYSTAAEA